VGAAVIAALATSAAPALAGDGQASIIQDDPLLLHQGPDVRNRTLDDIRALGADTIRLAVLWRSLAPKPGRAKAPRFDATNPAAYPVGAWDPYDDVVRGASARGLGVLMTPSSPIPVWASGCRDRKADERRACKPSSKLFAAFVRALGRRYDGTYADENQGGGVLPRVSQWSIWNEPNISGWLQPQYALVGKTKIAYAAYLYRALATRSIAALAATGHGAAEVLLGETAPLGRTTGPLATRPVSPRIFIRELLCLDRRGRKLRGRAAAIRGCRGKIRFNVGGYAHHPYTRGGSQPPTVKGGPDEITLAATSRLTKLLDQGARAGRIAHALPIHFTEFGFQTNPPDRLFGVTEEQQAQFINQSDYMAWRNRRVQSVAQYKVYDEPKVANFQTGLRFVDGRPKDAYPAYKLPLYVVRRGGELVIYGQIRPAAENAREEVQLQRGADFDGPFTTILRVAVQSPRGHFTTTIPYEAGTWRLRWAPSTGGATVTSRVATPAKR
jgi:hypothetical protein